MHIAWWVIVLVAVAVVLSAVFVYRRRQLLVLRGAIEMSLNRGSGMLGGWVLGIASYAGDELRWYRMSSLRPGPSLRLDRRQTVINGPTYAPAGSGTWLPPNPVVLVMETPSGAHTVAVPESALPGLLSWWEAAGPTWHA